MVYDNYRDRPSEAQTTSATIKVPDYSRAPPREEGKNSSEPLFSFELLDLFLASHGREERYLIVACTADVPEAVGP